mgnify:CR=1 FL=1
MDNTALIKRATVDPAPRSLWDDPPKVTVELEDGTVEVLFTFFPEEISFTEDELIGMTVKEARDLKVQKDLAHLRS